jgi:hypothetical protein
LLLSSVESGRAHFLTKHAPDTVSPLLPDNRSGV